MKKEDKDSFNEDKEILKTVVQELVLGLTGTRIKIEIKS